MTYEAYRVGGRWLCAAVAGWTLLALGCGGAGPGDERFVPEQATVDEIEHRLSLPNGGFAFEPHRFGFDVAPMDEEARARAGQLGANPQQGTAGAPDRPFPPTPTNCLRGLVHGRWKLLDSDLGVVMGAVHNQDLEQIGRFGGIFGHGRLYGIISSDSGDPRFVVRGAYSGEKFEADLLDQRSGSVGRMSGVYNLTGTFVGLWHADCQTPPPPPRCTTHRLEGACYAAPVWRQKAETVCRREGRVLRELELGYPCAVPPPPPFDGGPVGDAWIGDAGVEPDSGANDSLPYDDAGVDTDSGAEDAGPYDDAGGRFDGGHFDDAWGADADMGPVDPDAGWWTADAGHGRCPPPVVGSVSFTCCALQPPPPPPGQQCISDVDCESLDNPRAALWEGPSYCHKERCRGGVGRCRQRPDACAEIFAPVCGCNALTYDNACMAAQLGINVAHPGTCGKPACFEEASGRRYLSTDPYECTLIDFRCPTGQWSFSDECGCGCLDNGLLPESGSKRHRTIHEASAPSQALRSGVGAPTREGLTPQ